MLMEHLRSDVLKVDDLQTKALFEFQQKLLAAFTKLLPITKEKNEPAWRQQYKG